jgi:flagellar biosynthesis protein FlhF
MKVRKFAAATSREALAQVKKELGADAVILSNRTSQGGVEILALAHKDVAGVVDAAPRREAVKPQAAPKPLKDFARKVDIAAPAALAVAAPDMKLFEEMRAMRGLVERQLATLAWSEEARRNPLRAQVMRELIGAGFSAPLGRAVSAALPATHGAPQARAWLRQVLARNLKCANDTDNLVERGGTVALVGPTGVGKTTTVAKLAARCVVRFGAQRLALITTDSYRIGAQDQLRIYARILGVPVHAVQDAAGLEQALQSLGDRHLVLVDTVGMGQRDPRMAEQMELLAAPRVANRPVRRVLLLNAASQIETLEDVVQAYGRQPGGDGLSGVIITKLDEARRPGAALDCAMRHHLPLAFVTDGQRVPEDIRLPVAAELVEQALAGAASSPFALSDDELFHLPAGAAAAFATAAPASARKAA